MITKKPTKVVVDPQKIYKRMLMDCNNESNIPEQQQTKSKTSKLSPNQYNYPKHPSVDAFNCDGIISALGGNLPQWGGTVEFSNCRVMLTNTYPIDDMLVIIYMAMTKEKSITYHDIPICKLFRELKALMHKGGWVAVKLRWATEMLGQKVSKDKAEFTMNLFGSELCKFVAFLSDFYVNTQRSVCSEEKCPRKVRVVEDKNVGKVRKGDGDLTLYYMINEYMTPYYSNCRAKRSDEIYDNGFRVWVTREFVNLSGSPPILVIAAAHYGTATANKFPTEKTITLKDNNYALLAITINTGNNFVAIMPSADGWWLYTCNGMSDKLLTKVHALPKNCKMEHLVYVREI